MYMYSQCLRMTSSHCQRPDRDGSAMPPLDLSSIALRTNGSYFFNHDFPIVLYVNCGHNPISESTLLLGRRTISLKHGFDSAIAGGLFWTLTIKVSSGVLTSWYSKNALDTTHNQVLLPSV